MFNNFLKKAPIPFFSTTKECMVDPCRDEVEVYLTSLGPPPKNLKDIEPTALSNAALTCGFLYILKASSKFECVFFAVVNNGPLLPSVFFKNPNLTESPKLLSCAFIKSANFFSTSAKSSGNIILRVR